MQQDKCCRARLDHETAQAVADPFGSESRENLMGPVKNGVDAAPRTHAAIT